MFIQMRKITVAEGYADQVVERFSQPGIVEQQDGFVDMKILVKKDAVVTTKSSFWSHGNRKSIGKNGRKAMPISLVIKRDVMSQSQSSFSMSK